MKKWLLAALAGAVSFSACAEILTFDAKDTGPNHYYRPTTDGDYDWTEGSATFNMRVSWSGGAWAGFTYSDVQDTTSPGYTNQYAVYGDGLDYSDGGVYVIGYVDSYNSYYPTISFANPSRVNGLYVNNTTYAALTMKDGNGFARAFTTNDWFKLTIHGYDASGNALGTIDYLLADFTGYTEGDNKDLYMTTNWTWVDLSSFGDNVGSLQFTLSSSDTGSYGMNTPAYFALDQVEVVPEPGTLLLMVVGGGGLFLYRRKLGRV